MGQVERGDVIQESLLSVRGITKRFFGVHALEEVSFDVAAGVVHAVVGQNGAGKSTLMKCLMGVHQPDAGEVALAGAPYLPANPHEAVAAGVDIVFQEIEILPNLTIAENLFLGREPMRGGMVDFGAMFEASSELLARVGLELGPGQECDGLGVATLQLIQIARALRGATRLLIMDEPTSALTEHEIARLFEVVDSLRASGLTILYVSHKLDEIFRLADSVSVLRDGKLLKTMPISETSPAELVRLMAGEAHLDQLLLRSVDQPLPALPRLAAHNLQLAAASPALNFEVFETEIVGLFGIVGAGRTELARALFGLDAYHSGTVKLDGELLPAHNPIATVERGVALLPENRKQQGLILEMEVRWNASLASLRKLAPYGLINAKAEHEAVSSEVEQLSIVVNNLDDEVKQLSGGNQQKVVFAKWLMTEPRVLLLDEPTKGIDVRAKAELHRRIRYFADQGLAVLLISSELDEVLTLCDRVLVLREGRLVADLPHADATREKLLAAAVSEEAAAPL